MNCEEAKVKLSFHSGRNENVKDIRWEKGFLGSLRPFNGMALVEENFHDIISCIKALAEEIESLDRIDKDLVNDISGIICFGRAWAVHKDGMLRRNNLITTDESIKIEEWIDCISYAWTILLDTGDKSLAFEPYLELTKN